MKTVYGELWDELGHIRGETRATPAAALLDYQDDVLVDRDHDHMPVGKVVHLERRNGSLWAVAEVDDLVAPAIDVVVGDKTVTVDHDLYWSSETVGDANSGILLSWLSLTAFPARVCPTPIAFLPGAADHGRVARDRWGLDGWQGEMLTRAARTRMEHRRGLTVRDANRDARVQWLQRHRMDDPGAAAVLAEVAEDQAWARKRMRYSTPRRGSIISVR